MKDFKLKSLLLITLCFCPFIFADQESATSHSEKEIWIDVRTTEEFNHGHIDKAAHIPFQDIVKRISPLVRSKDTKIRLYCEAGVRAQIAKKALEAQGYTNVINDGGIRELKRKGMRIVK